ncbi:MAG: hypothetical protein ABUL44_02860 [Flavobacterium sp.]
MKKYKGSYKTVVRPVSVLLLQFAILVNLSAQSGTEDFEISYPARKIENSLYNKINFADIRYDTTNIGIVQLGVFNRKVKVVPKIPFQIQLQNVVNALTDSTSGSGELLFLMRHFNFAEVTSAMSEKGYCYLRAELYAKTNDQFQKINVIDTIIVIKSMDVTRGLFRNGSELISNFIGTNLLYKPEAGIAYTYNEVLRMDSIEKSKIPLYTRIEYTNGVYNNYNSFAYQTPDYMDMTVKLKDDMISSVKIQGKDGEMQKIDSKDIYAVVYEGKIFIATEYGYYPAEKKGENFYFTGKAKAQANNGDVIAASMFFGIIGGLIASEGSSATFRMKIDHKDGGLIRLRVIK